MHIVIGADLKVRHNNTEESVLFYKNNVFTKKSIGNFALPLDPRTKTYYLYENLPETFIKLEQINSFNS